MAENSHELARKIMKGIVETCLNAGFYETTHSGYIEEYDLSSDLDNVNVSVIYSQSFGFSVRTRITVHEGTNYSLSNSYKHVTFAASAANILQLIEDCRAFVKSSPVNPK